MAGYILKIVIENTHPPVWRRVVIPEGISFYGLHEIIQIVFGWHDDHLHSFTFSGNVPIEITDGKDSYNGTESFQDDKICVDGIIELKKWIRYTYDFGDCWEHKIYFEKKDDDYRERYATLLKYKGNDFEEDSGGVWAGCHVGTAYSAEQVNERLHSLVLPKIKQGKEGNEIIDAIKCLDDMKSIVKNLNELQNNLLALKQTENNYCKTESPLISMCIEWENFCFEKGMYDECYPDMRNNVKKSVPVKEDKCAYEQMTLPFVEMPKDTVTEVQAGNNAPIKGYYVQMAEPEYSMAKYFSKLTVNEANDYCSYLGISVMKNEHMSEAISRTFMEHPEYMLYYLSVEDVKLLLKLSKEDGIVNIDDNMAVAVESAIHLGLLQVTYAYSGRDKNKSACATVRFALDAVKLLERISDKKAQKKHQQYMDIRSRIMSIISFYVMLPIEELFRIYRLYWDANVKYEDFLRDVYWGVRFDERIVTLMCQNQKCVLYPGFDENRIYAGWEKYCKDIPFYELSKQEMVKWQNGFDELYVEWYDYAEFLYDVYEIDEEELDLLVGDIFYDCLNSCSSTHIVDDFMTFGEKIPEITFRIMAWKMAMDVAMNTRLPGLKGYTRKEYAAMKGMEPQELNLFDKAELETDIKKDTYIYRMPEKVQCELYDIIKNDAKEECTNILSSYIKEIQADNMELSLLLAIYYIEEMKMNKALLILKDLKKKLPFDESIQDLIRDIKHSQKVMKSQDNFYPAPWDEEYYVPEQKGETYKREQAKIGRNAPCPCGSGKKYKMCCGR